MRLCRQYAYVPPSTSQLLPPQLSHDQSAPRIFQRTQPGQRQGPIQRQNQPAMLPVAGSSRLKPANQGTPVLQNQGQRPSGQKQRVMGPPPTPQHIRQQQAQHTQDNGNTLFQSAQIHANAPPSSSRRKFKPPTSTTRFLPTTQGFAPPGPMAQNQWSAFPTPSSGAPQRFTSTNAGLGSRAPSVSVATIGSSSRAPSRAALPPHMSGGNQRMPFIPGPQDGFG